MIQLTTALMTALILSNVSDDAFWNTVEGKIDTVTETALIQSDLSDDDFWAIYEN